MNPYQDELQRSMSQNSANGLPDKDMFGRAWGSMAPAPKVAAPKMPPPPAPTSNTMPVGGPPKAVTPAPSSPPAGASVQPSIYTGYTPKYAMEGFDFAREQNTGKSAKDAFAYLSNQAPPPPIHDKAALGAWFSQYIKPGMDALGHTVSSVDGDKFRFKNWQGEFDVDYGRGAGADGGALAWQAEDANGAPQAQSGLASPWDTQRQAPVNAGAIKRHALRTDHGVPTGTDHARSASVVIAAVEVRPMSMERQYDDQNYDPQQNRPTSNTAGPAGSPWDPYNARIQEGYQSFLGRSASDDELRLHHGNPTGYADPNHLNDALRNIEYSPEAIARRGRPAAVVPTVTNTNTNTNTNPNTTTNTRPNTTGSVPPVSGGGGGASNINVPSAQLPSDIAGLFGRVPERTPIQNAYQDALLKFMGKSQETPTLDDSVLGPQTEVFRAQQQRNTERNRRVSAERAAANGMGQSGYLDNQIMQGEQQQAFNTASYNANLLGGEMNKRREQLQAGLHMAGQTGNQEATRELQSRLAQVQAAMQQQSMNLQGQLGFGDLDLRWALGSEGLNQNALRLVMGNG